jgi:hypothetical protein
MQFDIKIFDKQDENKGKYNMLTVDYKDLGSGKNGTRKIVSFKNKEVYTTLKNANQGDEFTVVAVKGEQYWEWQSVTPRGEPVPASTGGSSNVSTTKSAAPSPKSTYETPEERAKRQVLIVRQSSLSSAIELLKTDKKSPTVPEVLQVAKQFENYVFGNDDPFGLDSKEPVNKLPTIDDLEDDIPM